MVNFLKPKKKNKLWKVCLLIGLLAILVFLFYQNTRDDVSVAHSVAQNKPANYQSKQVLPEKRLSDNVFSDSVKAEAKVPDSQLNTVIIHLKYAKAKQIESLLKNKQGSMLSDEGVVSMDPRTNSLLIQDDALHIKELKNIIHKLDVPVKQVMISARIVNIDSDYERELGVRFGLTSGHHLSGTLDGANALAAGASHANVKPSQRLMVDLPAVAKNAAHLGLALFQITKGTLLDLELSALESEGHAEIISSPELIASNQQPAMIQAGQEIPYQEKAYGGTTSVTFKKAVLSLEVTPQIIPDGKIILHLKVNQDKRSSKEVLGVPAIDTREIKTQALVANGKTVVLGGIYEQTKTNKVDRVPFFASLPLVGALFRYKKVLDSRRELLIFVTPTIVKN